MWSCIVKGQSVDKLTFFDVLSNEVISAPLSVGRCYWPRIHIIHIVPCNGVKLGIDSKGVFTRYHCNFHSDLAENLYCVSIKCVFLVVGVLCYNQIIETIRMILCLHDARVKISIWFSEPALVWLILVWDFVLVLCKQIRATRESLVNSYQNDSCTSIMYTPLRPSLLYNIIAMYTL